MIESHLEQLGFNKKEISVFLCLAETGLASAREVSSRSGIPRSTVYTILDSLTERGFVNPDTGSGSASYSIASPSAFLSMLEGEKEELTKKEKTVQQLVDLLRPSFTAPDSGVPKIRFFSGKENIEKMLFGNYKIWRKCIAEGDYTWWGYQDTRFVEQYRKWLDVAWRSTADKERVHLFSNHSPVEEQLHGRTPGRIIKPLPQGFEISSTIWALGEYIVMISTQHKPHYAFQLVDRTFTSNLKNLFQFLWVRTDDLNMASNK